jgi:hypothetical protein
MIWFFLIYILFQVIFDHWSVPGQTWDVIYFAFQYGWIGSLSFYLYLVSPINRSAYGVISLIMLFLSINELSWLNADITTYAMMTGGEAPAYALSAVAVVLFLWFILSKKLQWEN